MIHHTLIQRIYTGNRCKLPTLHLSNQRFRITRISDQHIKTTVFEICQTITGKCIDMIQRQRSNHDLLALYIDVGKPGINLSQISHHIAVSKHGALGNTGCASGVLQKGQIVAMHFARMLKHFGIALHSIAECYWQFELVIGNHPLEVAHSKINQRPLRPIQHVTNLGNYGAANLSIPSGQCLLQNLAAVGNNNNGFGFRIFQLMMQLPMGV